MVDERFVDPFIKNIGIFFCKNNFRIIPAPFPSKD